MPVHKLKKHPRATIGVLALIAAALLSAALGDRLDAAMVLDQGRALTDWAAANPVWAGLGYLAFATLGKVGPLPGGIVVMLSGGFLFGGVVGGMLAALGSGVCAMLVTLLGRRYFLGWLRERYGRRIEALHEAIGRDAFWLILAIRLFPVVPAWFGNLVPVPLRIRPWAVWIATSLGVLPLSLIVGQLGAELQSLTEVARFSADALLQWDILGLLLALTAMSLLPIAVRRRFLRGAGK